MVINKLSSNNNYLFVLIILIFVPKIDLISIEGYHQGIRLEDIILFIYIINFFINYNKTLLIQPYQFKGPFIILLLFTCAPVHRNVKSAVIVRLFFSVT